MRELELPPVDKIEVLSLMDNFTDTITPRQTLSRDARSGIPTPSCALR